MSKNSKKMRQELKRANVFSTSLPSTVSDKAHDQSPRQPEPEEKPKQGIVDWVRSHKVTTSIGAFFVFSLGGILNFFGSNPRILYFPAIMGCILICWIVVSGTHKYVDSKLKEASSNKKTDSSSVETANKLICVPPELPDGCDFAYVSMADWTVKIPLKALKNGLPYPITPHSGVDFGSVLLKRNRLYLQMPWIPHGTTNVTPDMIYSRGLMFSGLQSDYQMNCTANAFEIVNQDLSPVFQMIYDRPNNIIVNGVVGYGDSPRIFADGRPVVTTVVFGKQHSVFTVTNNADMRNFLLQFKTKRKFKYPSWQYPGVYETFSAE